MRRLLAVAAVVGISLAGLAIPNQRAAAQTQVPSEMEISDSCVAAKQRIPTLTVWGSGWDSFLQRGKKLTLEWSWGGAPSTPQPAKVTPTVQNITTGTFTVTFDVTGVSPGLSAFNMIWQNTDGTARTTYGTINLDIKSSCPQGWVTCTSEGGAAVLDAAVSGYSTSWRYEFFYQYRRAGQQGPATGAVGSDGAVHGRLRGLSQVANATVTARIYQPPAGDVSGRYYFVTFAAPICDPPAGTTTTSVPGATTTTGPPDDSVPEATTTTRPSGGGPVPTTTTTVALPPTIDVPPPTPGATLAVTPKLGPTGFVASATGTGFPPGPVELRWSPGIGRTTTIAGPDGRFTVRVLVLPKDQLGPRALIATGGATTAYDGFLVVPSSVQPSSGREVAQITRTRRFTQR